MQDQIIDQAVALNKLIKAIERSLAKMVITDAQNNDLVQMAKNKYKKKNKQAGNLGRARVMGGKIEGPRALEEAIREEFQNHNQAIKTRSNRNDFYTRFL